MFLTTSFYLLSEPPFCRSVQYACRTCNHISIMPDVYTATLNRGVNTEHYGGANSITFHFVSGFSNHLDMWLHVRHAY